ncbi:hypothetical protein ACI799_09125 [Blastococcus sp. SYSU DS0753]
MSSAIRRTGAGLPATSAGRFLIALLLVLACVSWRRGQYFSGSLDPVVVGKALCSGLALLLAAQAARRGPRRPLGTGTLWVVAVALTSSVFGALTHGTVLAGGLVAARVGILALTVHLLLRTLTADEAFAALARACGAVALVAAVTGLPAAGDGRLAGGLPTLSPNELALLAGVVVLHVAWRVVRGDAGPGAALVAAGALGVVWATGSRTGLLALLAAVLVVAAHLRRAPVGLVVGGLLVAAVGAAVTLSTGALTGFAVRDGDGVSTLESRFIAWDAATRWGDTAWQTLFGGGLSVKVIPVAGQYWDSQPLDSSWVSALVQNGVLGLLLLAGWVAWVLRGTVLVPRPHRALFLGLLVFLLGRSVVESGLFDATPAFLFFVAVSFAVEGGSRGRLRPELERDPPLGPRQEEAVR